MKTPLLVSVLTLFLYSCSSPPPPSPPEAKKAVVSCTKGTTNAAGGWSDPIGQYVSGLKLYQGDDDCKRYVATVLGGADNYLTPTGQRIQAVLLEFEDGTQEWKSRRAVSDQLWIDLADPALKVLTWEPYDCEQVLCQ